MSECVWIADGRALFKFPTPPTGMTVLADCTSCKSLMNGLLPDQLPCRMLTLMKTSSSSSSSKNITKEIQRTEGVEHPFISCKLDHPPGYKVSHLHMAKMVDKTCAP